MRRPAYSFQHNTHNPTTTPPTPNAYSFQHTDPTTHTLTPTPPTQNQVLKPPGYAQYCRYLTPDGKRCVPSAPYLSTAIAHTCGCPPRHASLFPLFDACTYYIYSLSIHIQPTRPIYILKTGTPPPSRRSTPMSGAWWRRRAPCLRRSWRPAGICWRYEVLS